jgi:glycosyltransferase involved in cell wall biosynthesis
MIKKKLRVALFVPWIKSKGGIERTILALLKGSRHDIDVYTLSFNQSLTFDEYKRFKITDYGKKVRRSLILRGALFLKDSRSANIDLSRYDALVISTAGISELILLNRDVSKIVTIAMTHTPLRIAHNMYDYYKKQSLAYKIELPLFVSVYRLLERAAWKKVDFAFVHSEEVKKRLLATGLIDASHILKDRPHINYTRVSRSKTTKKFLLYNSRYIDYKRQDLAISAFKASSLKSRGFKLVLSGFAEDEGYFERIKELSAGDNSVIVMKNIDDKMVSRLYRECYATLFLAFNEDTGFVPLESLAYGKPVICINEGGPREFIKNGTNGLLVNDDPDSIASAMEKVLDKRLYKRLVAGALKSPRYDDAKFITLFDKNLDTAVRRGKRRA